MIYILCKEGSLLAVFSFISIGWSDNLKFSKYFPLRSVDKSSSTASSSLEMFSLSKNITMSFFFFTIFGSFMTKLDYFSLARVLAVNSLLTWLVGVSSFLDCKSFSYSELKSEFLLKFPSRYLLSVRGENSSLSGFKAGVVSCLLLIQFLFWTACSRTSIACQTSLKVGPIYVEGARNPLSP